MKKHLLLSVQTFLMLLLFLSGGGQKLQAQATNCSNLDFSYGSFTYWTGKTGTFIQKTLTTPDPYQLTSGVIQSSDLPNQKTGSNCGSRETSSGRFVINTDTDEYDRNVVIGGKYMLKKIPDGYHGSVRLGNACSGSEAEALYYTMQVSEPTALLTLMYALVLEAPHEGVGQKYLNPAFNVEIRDMSGNLIPCAEYTVYSYLPEIQAGNDTTFELFNSGGMLYRKWMPLVINLKPYVNQQIQIRVAMGDCTLGGHYGYAYITGKCSNDQIETGTYMGSFDSDTAAFAEAPAGLAYRWVFSGEDPNDPSTRILSTQQRVYLTDDDFGMKTSVSLDCHIQMLIPGGGCPSVIQTTINTKKPIVDLKCNVLENRVVNFDSTIILASSIPLDESTHYWDFGDGNTSNVKHPTHQYTAPGLYNITYSVSTMPDVNKNIYTSTKNIQIAIAQPATGITVSHDSIRLKKGATGQLTASVQPENASDLSVTWTSQNTAIATVDSTGLVRGIGVGITSVTAATENGKEAIAWVTVYDDLNIHNNNVENEKTLKIYPNPTKGILNIESKTNLLKVELLDNTGKILDTRNLDSLLNYQLNISNYADGVYFLQILTTKGVVVKKITKQ